MNQTNQASRRIYASVEIRVSLLNSETNTP